MKIPKILLKKLYVFGSLENTSKGIKFSIKNSLSDGKLTDVKEVKIDGKKKDLDQISFKVNDETFMVKEIHEGNPIKFIKGQFIDVFINDGSELEMETDHNIYFVIVADEIGVMTLDLEDFMTEKKTKK